MRNTAVRRKTIAGAAVAVVSALALVGCGSDDEPTTTTPSAGESIEPGSLGDISVQYSWIKNEEFAGEFYADSEGYYTDAGFGTVTGISGPSTGTAELLQGSVQFALSDAASVATVIAEEEAPLKIVGATFQKNPFTILSLKDGADIATPQDLVGKTIGVQSSNTNVFKALLAANDISEDDVNVVPVEYDPTPLIKGDVDGFVAYLTNEAITVGAEHEVTNLAYADNGLPYVAETITVTDEYLAENPEAVKAFLTAEIKGWTDVFKNDEETTVALIEKYYNAAAEAGELTFGDLPATTGTSLAAEKELISTEETEVNGLFTISDELKAETIESMANAGIDVTAEQLFDTSILDSIYAENPDLKDYLP